MAAFAQSPSYPFDDLLADSVLVEARSIEPQLGRVRAQVVVLEGLLAVVQQVMHLPEPALTRRGLGRGGRRERMRMDRRQRKVPEGEADAAVELPLDTLDLAIGHARVGAFVVAVLENETTGLRAANVVDGCVEGLQNRETHA